MVEEEQITKNVFHALEIDSKRRLEAVQRAPRLMRVSVRNFVAVEGTPFFEGFRTGQIEYLRFVLRKQSQ